MLVNPRYSKLPIKPLFEGEMTERQVRAWARWSKIDDLEKRIWLTRQADLMSAGGQRDFGGPGGEVALRYTQAGLETTRGTAVAATRIVYGSGLMQKEQPRVRPEEEDRATFIEHYRSQPGLINASFPFKCSLTYEDLPWWAQLSHKGGVTGVVRATTAYDYAFTPTAGSDDLKSATFEWGDDTQGFEMPFGMVDTFELAGALGSFWSGEFGVIGADRPSAAKTGALSDRTVEDILMHLAKCSIGAAGAVPSSYMTARFIGFRFRGDNRLRPKYFADGSATAAKYGGMGRGKRNYNLEVTQEGLAATITELGVWEAGTAKVVRILAEGSVIAGSVGDVKRTADLIVAGKWSAFPVGNRDTNTIFTGMLQAEYDSALGYDHRMVLTNALSALP